MKITVVGLGYAGLVTAAGFAAYGHDVVGLDIDTGRVRALLEGEPPPFFEPGLTDQLCVNRGRLSFTTLPEVACAGADVVFLAVGTPTAEDGESADLAQLRAAVISVMPHLEPHAVLVIKSTVPPGTNARVLGWLADRGITNPVANVPEFLREGTAVQDVLHPERVVIGADDARAIAPLVKLHRQLVRSETDIYVMKPASAELTKYASNAMLATRISFMNDLAQLAEVVGADIREVQRGVGADSRIGPQYLHAGVGWGGSCFGKDVRALVHTAKTHDVDLWVAESAEKVNNYHRRRFAERIIGAMATEGARLDNLPQGAQPLKGKTIAVWGLSFKPDTDDVRDSPALSVVRELLDAGATVQAHDPVAGVKFVMTLGPAEDRFLLFGGADAALAAAHALVLITEWREYRVLDWDALKARMVGRFLFDGRNVWDKAEAQAQGFSYMGVGR